MEALNFFTKSVGRLTHGSLSEKRSKDNDNRPIPLDEQRFEFGVSFPKAEIWSLFAEEWYPYLASALASDANGLNRMSQWFQAPGAKGTFSMKVSDGDLPNSKGQVNENTKGCFIIWFSSIDVQTVDPANQDIDAGLIKRGFYVQVAGSIKPNGQPGDRAGIYVNGNIVRLIGEGEEIRGGIDADTAFGGTAAPTALPPGARPLGSSNGAAGAFGAPSMPGVSAPAPTAPAVPGAAPAAPGGTAYPGNTPPPIPGVQPHTQILNGPGAAAPAGPPPLPGT